MHIYIWEGINKLWLYIIDMVIYAGNPKELFAILLKL